jgi:hypothetical protein
MRRLSLTLIASCGIALLSACNGGGYAFTGTNSNNTVTSVAFYNGSGQVNDFFVSPNGSSPIEINAVAQKGTGSQTQVVPQGRLTERQWDMRNAGKSKRSVLLLAPVPNADGRPGRTEPDRRAAGRRPAGTGRRFAAVPRVLDLVSGAEGGDHLCCASAGSDQAARRRGNRRCDRFDELLPASRCDLPRRDRWRGHRRRQQLALTQALESIARGASR